MSKSTITTTTYMDLGGTGFNITKKETDKTTGFVLSVPFRGVHHDGSEYRYTKDMDWAVGADDLRALGSAFVELAGNKEPPEPYTLWQTFCLWLGGL